MFFKKTAISAAISLVMASSAFSDGQQPPFKAKLDTVHYVCPEGEKHCFSAGWHFDYIGMPEVWNTIDVFGDYQNEPAITDFTVGIMDSGFGRNYSPSHEGLDQTIIQNRVNGNDGFGAGKKTLHGNLVSSIISTGKVDGNFATRPMIRAKTSVLAIDVKNGRTYYPTMVERLEVLLESGERPKIINVSYGFSTSDTSTRRRGVVFDEFLHYLETRNTRQFIENNPDVLFVFAAGNAGGNARKDNGMLHRVLGENGNYVLNKLNNLIVVGSNNAYGEIMRHSAFGRDVDIAAPSYFIGVSCYSGGASGMLEADISLINSSGENYGTVYGFDGDVSPGRTPIADMFRIDGQVVHEYYGQNRCIGSTRPGSGTSVAAPLVSGAAAILAHAGNDNSSPLQANEIKQYLVDSERSTTLKSISSNSGNGFIDIVSGNYVKIMGNDANPIEIPLLNVATSLNKFLATIPSEPTGDYVRSYTKDGFRLFVDGGPGMEYLAADDPRNELGFETLYVPPGDICFFTQRLEPYPSDISEEPVWPSLNVTLRGDKSETINVVFSGTSPFGVNTESSVCEISLIDLEQNSQVIGGNNEEILFVGDAGPATSVRTPNGFYIRSLNVNYDMWFSNEPQPSALTISYDGEWVLNNKFNKCNAWLILEYK